MLLAVCLTERRSILESLGVAEVDAELATRLDEASEPFLADATSQDALFAACKLDAFRRPGLGLDFFLPGSATGVTTPLAFVVIVAVVMLAPVHQHLYHAI